VLTIRSNIEVKVLIIVAFFSKARLCDTTWCFG